MAKALTSIKILAIFLLFVSSAGCDVYGPAGSPEFEEGYVGLTGTRAQSPTTIEMMELDEVKAHTMHGCPDETRKPDYDLQWDGNNFTANYSFTCQVPNGTNTCTINLSGKLSSNMKTLETFTGSRKLFIDTEDLTQVTEYFIAVKNVPLEGDEEVLSAYIDENIGEYVVNAYWTRTKTVDGATENLESGTLDYENPRMQLNILFNRIYTY
jgi:hypothetical protein